MIIEFYFWIIMQRWYQYFEILQALICLIDKKTGEKKQVRPRFIKPDQVGIARMEIHGGMICLETFKDFPQMGRFTLRDEGEI